jgi:hypothetical protein
LRGLTFLETTVNGSYLRRCARISDREIVDRNDVEGGSRMHAGNKPADASNPLIATVIAIIPSLPKFPRRVAAFVVGVLRINYGMC